MFHNQILIKVWPTTIEARSATTEVVLFECSMAMILLHSTEPRTDVDGFSYEDSDVCTKQNEYRIFFNSLGPNQTFGAFTKITTGFWKPV